MSRFRPTRREVPGLNTASLPDLIFTVLFFFMIVTHIRETQLWPSSWLASEPPCRLPTRVT